VVYEDGPTAGLADAFGDHFAGLVLDIGDDDRGAFLGEANCDRVPDAAGRSGDECNSAFQPLHDDLLDNDPVGTSHHHRRRSSRGGPLVPNLSGFRSDCHRDRRRE
jgi:hypothetical protein